MPDNAEARDQAVFVISVATELTGLGPHAIRQYERAGLILPSRTSGGSRRYSPRDIDRLRRIAALLDQGLNLAGVREVLRLEAEIVALRQENDELRRRLA